jgi:hypothetical protein
MSALNRAVSSWRAVFSDLMLSITSKSYNCITARLLVVPMISDMMASGVSGSNAMTEVLACPSLERLFPPRYFAKLRTHLQMVQTV